MTFLCLCNLYHNDKRIKNRNSCSCKVNYSRDGHITSLTIFEDDSDNLNQNILLDYKNFENNHKRSEEPYTFFFNEYPIFYNANDLNFRTSLTEWNNFQPDSNLLYKNIQVLSLNKNKGFKYKTQVKKQLFGDKFYYEYLSTKGPLYFCPNRNCFNVYKTKNGLIYHIETGCKCENIVYRFICPFQPCIKRFKTESGIKYHIKTRHNHNN